MSTEGNFKDLVDVLQKSVAAFGDHNLFGTKRDGVWQWITYREFGRRVDDLRGGLKTLGVGPGDTVAIISGNRVEWAVAAYATYGLGARFCPMYEHQLDEDRKYIVEDSGAKVIFTSTYPIYETTREWVGTVGQVEHVFCMALPEEDEASFAHLESVGRRQPAPVAEIDPESICGFIYTSGTTGKPKGVLLSHRNIVSNLNGVARFFPIDTRDVSVSFLPWAHSFGQTCELHMLLSRGAAIAIAESIDKLIDNFAEVKPTIILAVPRIFNRIYDGLQKKIAEEGGIKKRLFDAAMANAEVRKKLAEQGKTSALVELKHKFYDALVFSKIRARFGGRLRYAISGGAALSPEVADFIDKLGIFVCEGYGLTETSPIVSSNRIGARKIGSVGQPIDGVEVIIDTSVVDDEDSQDGEIVVRGPNVMVGYHNLPEATREVIREDGGFRTGDLGRMDEDGFLYITGRIKEQYKLENGKYVVPGPLEEQLQLSGFISQAFIDGANRPYNVALIVPDRAAVERWAKENGIAGDYPAILQHDKTRALFEREIAEHSKGFKGYERIKGFDLLPEEFSVDNGLLTPKMSVKRKAVVERYRDRLAALHAAAASPQTVAAVTPGGGR
ncbi:MAG: long-chain fatty acid--CoA ligase [Acidobacteria bacterium]|nr:MAG: long-chain fatty acid--CoA ligase [Acidobacteriota bacterium]